ncbi:hypothetical protein [Reyranella soli]|uniref:hypothetical protein n=1 Tax=Reyranella soli TaxID=1230389 RepID=UPI001FE2DEDE|nr:hypothetical protein [Reyranella soli]
MNAWRSTVSAMARRILGSSNGGLSRLIMTLAATPLLRMVHRAFGASLRMVLSSGTVTSGVRRSS